MAAPAVVVFNPAGNFIRAWGGPGAGYEWVEREHGIHIDHKGFAWIGGNECPTSGNKGFKPVADDQLAQVHARRQIRAADRQVEPEQGRRRHRQCASRG